MRIMCIVDILANFIRYYNMSMIHIIANINIYLSSGFKFWRCQSPAVVRDLLC